LMPVSTLNKRPSIIRSQPDETVRSRSLLQQAATQELIMHEISLCQSVIEIIEEQAAKNGAKKVTGVWLEIGANACIEEHALRFCFDIVCRGTVAEGGQLHLLHLPAKAWCWQCQKSVHIEGKNEDAECPHCHSGNLTMEKSDDLRIKQMEIS